MSLKILTGLKRHLRVALTALALVALIFPAPIREANATTLFSSFFTAIKSIQTGTIVIATGSTSNTATITSVTTTKSVLTLLGMQSSDSMSFGSSGSAPGSTIGTLTLTDATTVTFARNNSTGSRTLTAAFQVVEYY